MHLRSSKVLFSWKSNVQFVYSTTYILDIDNNFGKLQYFMDYYENKPEMPTAMIFKIFYGEKPKTINKTDFFITAKHQIGETTYED